MADRRAGYRKAQGEVTLADLLSHASVLDRSHRLASAQEEIRRTVEVGRRSREPRETGPAWAQWHHAVESFRVAIQETYGSPLWRRLKAELRSGDPTAREAALVYLEADPWCFRSGYEKAELMKGLSDLNLSDRERARIRRLVLDLVQLRRRREFPQLARLAWSVWNTELDDRLEEVARAAQPWVGDQIADLRNRVVNRARSTGNRLREGRNPGRQGSEPGLDRGGPAGTTLDPFNLATGRATYY